MYFPRMHPPQWYFVGFYFRDINRKLRDERDEVELRRVRVIHSGSGGSGGGGGHILLRPR